MNDTENWTLSLKQDFFSKKIATLTLQTATRKSFFVCLFVFFLKNSNREGKKQTTFERLKEDDEEGKKRHEETNNREEKVEYTYIKRY